MSYIKEDFFRTCVLSLEESYDLLDEDGNDDFYAFIGFIYRSFRTDLGDVSGLGKYVEYFDPMELLNTKIFTQIKR